MPPPTNITKLISRFDHKLSSTTCGKMHKMHCSLIPFGQITLECINIILTCYQNYFHILQLQQVIQIVILMFLYIINSIKDKVTSNRTKLWHQKGMFSNYYSILMVYAKCQSISLFQKKIFPIHKETTSLSNNFNRLEFQILFRIHYF